MLSRARPSSPVQSRRSRGEVAIAIGGVIALAIVSFLPIHDKLLLHTKGRLHFWGHAGAFSLISFLLVRTARSGAEKVLMVVCILALACGIEFGQHVYYREAVEWMDVLVDWIGILFGATMTTVER